MFLEEVWEYHRKSDEIEHNLRPLGLLEPQWSIRLELGDGRTGSIVSASGKGMVDRNKKNNLTRGKMQ